MGASESKIAQRAATKQEAPIKNSRVARLIDPRSPSVAIDRTPIQVGAIKTDELTSECPLVEGDPRSPTVGISRTPVREVMRAKVGSLARRLGMLFHMEAEGKVPINDVGAQEGCDVLEGEEPDSTEPLLTPPKPHVSDSLTQHSNLMTTPVQRVHSSCSPFVLLEQPGAEVEIETDDANLEEAEEACESPLHKRLSMSLITCLEGAPSPQILDEVHQDSSGLDHLYAPPAVTPEPTRDSSDPPVQQQELTQEVSKEASEAPVLQCPSDTHRLTLDMRSPSQLVFKPQWLGKGFGATGLRVRAVQGAKGGSSPLAVAVAVKSINNENKGSAGKQKQKEGRSPLQILQNSQRGHPQMRLKGSTPEKARLGQVERRVLSGSLNKEN
ncbi:cell division cycle-associated protein 3 [Syngnathus typhle]|uniref:cell division cycle-associated protein 3 n=1 Tax=Syngnathus typhle TaxID=161592 RepID=UPI002A69DDC8|nr:cell division cycle-associated protein 3 [Syngnathus typhle]XP_061145498.1 cell division cycle-associated protein 3 [Syngnathus typhle]